MYAYAANNPVHYIDPDGNSIYNRVNTRIANAIKMLYYKSETFRKMYRSLASEYNSQGQKLFVMIDDKSYKYAGNTQSQDCLIEAPSLVMSNIQDDDYKTEILPVGTEVQAIIINIDLDKIDSQNLNLLEVVAEEFSHADEAARQGTTNWNERAKNENKMPYRNRPEEKRAKEVTSQILQEIKDYEED